MNPFMNMNFAIPQPNMNYNQDMYHQFRNMYNNMPHNNMDFNQNMYQQFMNQNRMNMYRQNNNINQLFYMFLQWMNNYYGNNNMNNLNNENNNNNINNFNIDGQNNRNNFENEYPEEESQNLINVFFIISSSGSKFKFEIPYYQTIAYLLRLFIRKLGIRENALEKDIAFLYDANRLKVDDQRALYELFKDNSPKILVLDQLNNLRH
jgi:hypothetical protein